MSSNPCTCLQPALTQRGSSQACTTLEGRKLGLTTCWELGKKWELPIRTCLAHTHRSHAVSRASPSEVGGSWGFHSKQASELDEPRVLGLLKG